MAHVTTYKLSWREGLGYGAIAVAVGTVFPRVWSWMSWPARMGPRGLVAYVAFNTVLEFAVRTRLVPFLERVVEEQQHVRTQLAQTLGREPTDAELVEHLRLTCRR